MKRFRVVSNGYDIDEVNRFIDIVIRRLEKLNAENISLNETVKELQSKGNSNNVEIDRLEKALLAVQETAGIIKASAEEEANGIVAEAKNNANSIVHEALITAEKTEHDRLLLEKNMKIYKERMRAIVESQLNVIDDLDKIEL